MQDFWNFNKPDEFIDVGETRIDPEHMRELISNYYVDKRRDNRLLLSVKQKKML